MLLGNYGISKIRVQFFLEFCPKLFGCKTSVIRRLQAIQNSSARLILNIPKFGRIATDMRDTLHLLPVRQRITFKICMLVCNCVNGSAPMYLQEICNSVRADVHRPRLRSTDHGDLVVPRANTDTVSGPNHWNKLYHLTFGKCPINQNNLIEH